MCQMTVEKDSLLSNYHFIEFPEFLDFICRLADLKFRGTEVEHHDLVCKLEFLIDDIVLRIGVDKKNEVPNELLEISESDDEFG